MEKQQPKKQPKEMNFKTAARSKQRKVSAQQWLHFGVSSKVVACKDVMNF